MNVGYSKLVSQILEIATVAVHYFAFSFKLRIRKKISLFWQILRVNLWVNRSNEEVSCLKERCGVSGISIRIIWLILSISVRCLVKMVIPSRRQNARLCKEKSWRYLDSLGKWGYVIYGIWKMPWHSCSAFSVWVCSCRHLKQKRG